MTLLSPSCHETHPSSPRTQAFFRAQQAAEELGCRAESLRPFQHQSANDVFFTADDRFGRPLFFKAHVGAPEQLGGWQEPTHARWAAQTGLGAAVFDTSAPGVLVTEHLKGRSMTRDEGNDPHFMKLVAEGLRQLHRDDAVVHSFVAPTATGGARGRIADALRDGQVTKDLATTLLCKADWLDQEIQSLAYVPKRRFGDCHFGNWVVVEGRLYAVDLADSAIGDPMADLARYGFCQRFSYARMDQFFDFYAAASEAPLEGNSKRRLHLHTMAQNLDYFGYFASLTGGHSDQTKGMAMRLLQDEAHEPLMPRAAADLFLGVA